MTKVSVSDSDLQPKSLAWSGSWQPLGTILHLSNELNEFSQQLCRSYSTFNICCRYNIHNVLWIIMRTLRIHLSDRGCGTSRCYTQILILNCLSASILFVRLSLSQMSVRHVSVDKMRHRQHSRINVEHAQVILQMHLSLCPCRKVQILLFT